MDSKLRFNLITHGERLQNDILELLTKPIKGLTIRQYDPKTRNLRVKLRIRSGIYRDVVIIVILTINEDYPNVRPLGFIAPHHPFDHKFHAGIIDNTEAIRRDHRLISGAHSICTDILANHSIYFGRPTDPPKCSHKDFTLKTIFEQLLLFFETPNFENLHLPSNADVEELADACKRYQGAKRKKKRTRNKRAHESISETIKQDQSS